MDNEYWKKQLDEVEEFLRESRGIVSAAERRLLSLLLIIADRLDDIAREATGELDEDNK